MCMCVFQKDESIGERGRMRLHMFLNMNTVGRRTQSSKNRPAHKHKKKKRSRTRQRKGATHIHIKRVGGGGKREVKVDEASPVRRNVEPRHLWQVRQLRGLVGRGVDRAQARREVAAVAVADSGLNRLLRGGELRLERVHPDHDRDGWQAVVEAHAVGRRRRRVSLAGEARVALCDGVAHAVVIGRTRHGLVLVLAAFLARLARRRAVAQGLERVANTRLTHNVGVHGARLHAAKASGTSGAGLARALCVVCLILEGGAVLARHAGNVGNWRARRRHKLTAAARVARRALANKRVVFRLELVCWARGAHGVVCTGAVALRKLAGAAAVAPLAVCKPVLLLVLVKGERARAALGVAGAAAIGLDKLAHGAVAAAGARLLAVPGAGLEGVGVTLGAGCVAGGCAGRGCILASRAPVTSRAV